MDIKSNYQLSFKAVSINPKQKASKTAQVITWGFDRFGKLKASNYYDSFESLNRAHDAVTEKMARKRSAINSRPWFVPKSASLVRLDKKEIKIKEDLDNQRTELLAREAMRVKEMRQLVDKVNADTAFLENQALGDVKRIKKNDSMERFRARHSLVTGGFNSIAGYESEKNILKNHFISEIIKEQEGKKADVPGSVLFFGPTGNGKTTFAKAFAKETGCELVPIRLKLKGDDKYDVFLDTLKNKANEAESRFKEKNMRTIIFIDEIGKVTNEDSPITKNIHDFLKTCSKKYHCTVFGATNSPLEMKLPLTGSKSVFPYKISLDPPNKENKSRILEYYLYDRLPKDTDYNKMAEYMDSIEQKKGRYFNISQIKQTVGVNGYTKDLVTDDVYKEIDAMLPAIDTSSMEKYKKEVKTLIEHEVKE